MKTFQHYFELLDDVVNKSSSANALEDIKELDFNVIESYKNDSDVDLFISYLIKKFPNQNLLNYAYRDIKGNIFLPYQDDKRILVYCILLENRVNKAIESFVDLDNEQLKSFKENFGEFIKKSKKEVTEKSEVSFTFISFKTLTGKFSDLVGLKKPSNFFNKLAWVLNKVLKAKTLYVAVGEKAEDKVKNARLRLYNMILNNFELSKKKTFGDLILFVR